MSRYKNAEEVLKENINVLGPKLGPVYNELCNECVWLHIKWHQYIVLFGTKPERINLLNQAASLFFRIVQDTLWEDTLLHLARLTDKPAYRKEKNLSIQQLPALIDNIALRSEIKNLIDLAISASGFAKNWRDKHIAHLDLAIALKQGPEKLAPASRERVKEALQAVSRVLQRISEFYFNSSLVFDMVSEPNDAETLLYVIRNGIEAEEKRLKRIREGKYTPDDVGRSEEV